MATALACAGKSIGRGGRQRRSARRPEAGRAKADKNTGPRPYAIREVGRASRRDRAVGDRARRAVCASRARRDEPRRTRMGHRRRTRRECPGPARALARRAIQARETYRGHDESTALGGLALFTALRLAAPRAREPEAADPATTRAAIEEVTTAAIFLVCCGDVLVRASMPGHGASPAFRVSGKQTRRVYPKAPNLPARRARLSKKGKRFTGRVSGLFEVHDLGSRN